MEYLGLAYVRVSLDTSSYFGQCPGGFSQNLAYIRVLHSGLGQSQQVPKVNTKHYMYIINLHKPPFSVNQLTTSLHFHNVIY